MASLARADVEDLALNEFRPTLVAFPTLVAPPVARLPIPDPTCRSILGMRVDATTYKDATERIIRWAEDGASRYVCVATVNNVIESRQDGVFRIVMNQADLVTADGMPLVWGLKLLGVPDAERVCGPELTPQLLDRASSGGIPVGFYGGTPESLQSLLAEVGRRFPNLLISYAWSPPFRPLTQDERERVIGDLDRSGTRLLFVGLGAPKQELWMADLSANAKVVAIGIGAVFDLLAGKTRRSPRWLQAAGLEWTYRLLSEPRRLWRRYLYRNPKFVLLFGAQVVAERLQAMHRTSTSTVATAPNAKEGLG